ncbi:metallophosphoesterase family protein [Thiorhodococcus mannitoliphagus]|uniref:Metallophosphoesterase family protein n=1 Tax=Thiorhodococcus mannitoliphagus TaxID=329406 RepID=A0A6P1DYH4_9GAMM|nr:metallophosphoesterase family protein [Thiorhodococcus mannitoliphagus]NEX22530.1 metallophosphoesterase family protein [Thiorhodococcus mannitoliphagus]
MKIAIFSDVQGNLPAMEEAVSRIGAWDPDMVIMDGDLVNRGPSSLACLERFDDLRRTHGWLPVKGNHEAWILRCAREAPRDALDEALRRFADWTYQQVRPRLDALQDWPDHLCFNGGDDSSWVHVTHGTMASNRQGITTSVSDDDVRAAMPEDVSLFVTAHTHRPLLRFVDGTPVLNVGSVGSPFDGDPRGSYALLELRASGWHWDIIRFDYDRAQAERDFHDHGFIEGGGPLARILFEEWRRAHLLMPTWRRDFEPAVLAGERPLQPAVDAFLASID